MSIIGTAWRWSLHYPLRSIKSHGHCMLCVSYVYSGRCVILYRNILLFIHYIIIIYSIVLSSNQTLCNSLATFSAIC